MEVSYGEGVATHTGPESCATGRKVRGEALTGVRAGRVSSREIDGKLRGADALDTGSLGLERHLSHRGCTLAGAPRAGHPVGFDLGRNE